MKTLFHILLLFLMLILAACNRHSEDKKISISKMNRVICKATSPEKLIEFFHSVYPNLTHLLLIQRNSRIDTQPLIEAAQQRDIQIRSLVISSSAELNKSLRSLPDKTEGFLILKDHFMANEIASIAKTAHEKNIPLLSFDPPFIESGNVQSYNHPCQKRC